MVNRPNFEKTHLDQFWTWIVESIDSFGERLTKLEKEKANPGTKPKPKPRTKPRKKPNKKLN